MIKSHNLKSFKLHNFQTSLASINSNEGKFHQISYLKRYTYFGFSLILYFGHYFIDLIRSQEFIG